MRSDRRRCRGVSWVIGTLVLLIAAFWHRKTAGSSDELIDSAGSRDGPISAKGCPSPGSRQLYVILKLGEGEFEIGSIGIQHGAVWAWGIDTVIPMRALIETQGKAWTAGTAMKQFKAAWERFAADEANLTEFLNAKRKRR